MSNAASASLSSAERVAPGVLFRVSAVASAVAVGLVVVSAVLELGTTHWGIALVALPLLVANVVLARLAYRRPGGCTSSRSCPSSSRSRSAEWSPGAVTRRWAVALHVGAAAIALGVALVVVAGAMRGEAAPLASARDYLTLTKPRIMTLLLLTGAAGMFVGAQGVPPLDLFGVAMLGLALACGGASALNHVLDRDIDALMGSRTENRPVAAGRVSPEQALEFGVLLSALSFALLASAVNVLTAVLAAWGTSSTSSSTRAGSSARRHRTS